MYIYYNVTCTYTTIVHVYYILHVHFYITESSSNEVVPSSDRPKENTVWPFQSVKEKILDEEANLPPPQIDEVTGMYCLVSTSFVDSPKV